MEGASDYGGNVTSATSRSVTNVSPSPSDEELAAIVAALESGWPRPVAAATPARRESAWRFSNRWWSKPIAARRDRPYRNGA